MRKEAKILYRISIGLWEAIGCFRSVGEKFVDSRLSGTGSITDSICTNRGGSSLRLHLLLFPYAIALIAVGGAVLATLGLGSVVKHTPTLFLSSVILSSWLGGVWPGIFAGLLSAIAMDYYFIPPIYALGISLEEGPDMTVFAALTFLVSWLSRKQKQASDSPPEVQDRRAAKVCEGTPKLGQIEGQLRAGTSEDGLIRARAEVARRARTRTGGELVAPIVSEPRARTPRTEKLVHEFNGETPAPRKREAVLLDGMREYSPHPPILCSRRKSLFVRQGDYWTIQYQRQVVHLKATRGLQCLASLLGHPGRELHVSELITPVAELPVAAVAGLTSGFSKDDGIQMRNARFQDAGPILDARAKAEYARRLTELRDELEEAERLNDPERARKARDERDCIADQLTFGVGLGGRNRKAASQAERARSAVTKRIKNSIDKIAGAIPPLGRHLASRIKTGYFCCYNPNPDRPAVWEVRY
jgi:hypothetical protein